MLTPIITLALRSKRDIMLARQRARQVAGLLGFDSLEQARIAAQVFELAVNARQFAGSVALQFQLADTALQVFPVPLRTKKTRGTAPSSPSELNPAGVRRLIDCLRKATELDTRLPLRLEAPLPAKPPTVGIEELPWLLKELEKLTPANLFEEVQRQNQELLRALREPTSLLDGRKSAA
jgi:hypothetical protein